MKSFRMASSAQSARFGLNRLLDSYSLRKRFPVGVKLGSRVVFFGFCSGGAAYVNSRVDSPTFSAVAGPLIYPFRFKRGRWRPVFASRFNKRLPPFRFALPPAVPLFHYCSSVMGNGFSMRQSFFLSKFFLSIKRRTDFRVWAVLSLSRLRLGVNLFSPKLPFKRIGSGKFVRFAGLRSFLPSSQIGFYKFPRTIRPIFLLNQLTLRLFSHFSNLLLASRLSNLFPFRLTYFSYYFFFKFRKFILKAPTRLRRGWLNFFRVMKRVLKFIWKLSNRNRLLSLSGNGIRSVAVSVAPSLRFGFLLKEFTFSFKRRVVSRVSLFKFYRKHLSFRVKRAENYYYFLKVHRLFSHTRQVLTAFVVNGLKYLVFIRSIGSTTYRHSRLQQLSSSRIIQILSNPIFKSIDSRLLSRYAFFIYLRLLRKIKYKRVRRPFLILRRLPERALKLQIVWRSPSRRISKGRPFLRKRKNATIR